MDSFIIKYMRIQMIGGLAAIVLFVPFAIFSKVGILTIHDLPNIWITLTIYVFIYFIINKLYNLGFLKNKIESKLAQGEIATSWKQRAAEHQNFVAIQITAMPIICSGTLMYIFTLFNSRFNYTGLVFILIVGLWIGMNLFSHFYIVNLIPEDESDPYNE